MRTVAILAVGVGTGAFAPRSGPFAAKAKPTASAFSDVAGTATKDDPQRQISMSGILRYSDSRKSRSGFEGVLIQVPASETVLAQGDVLYHTGSETAHPMRGSLPVWRSFEAGMEDDEDIRQLETALRDLEYFDYESDDHFGWATTSAILEWQEGPDLPRTKTLPLGRIVFTLGDLRAGMVTARIGDRVAVDTELFDVTSTTQVVGANIRLSGQRLAIAGTAVAVKLSDAKKTAGKITSVGTPTEKSSGSGSGAGSGLDSGESKERVIPTTVTLTDASVTTNFQEVSVTVDLPSGKHMGVLSIPVEALSALSADQCDVEIVEAGGTTRKVPITVGLPVGGRVGIFGQNISEGQQVVVPQT